MTQRDAAWAVQQYEAVRALLPKGHMPAEYQRAANLGDIADAFDVFLLDAFGVLNVGNSAIAGATDRVKMLQDMGKRVLVLTNGATYPADAALRKFTDFGFHFELNDIVSSRDALSAALSKCGDAGTWGVMAGPASAVDMLGVAWHALGDEAAAYDQACGFLLLSSGQWSDSRQALLRASLLRHPRPVVVGNPDIVAPREDGFSLEPGHYAYQLARTLGIELGLFGKPFANIFEQAFDRLPAVDLGRVAMVGDTLHTDVLGGAAYGVQTVLVTDHGLFAGQDHAAFIAQTGIVPHYVIPGI